MKNSEKLTKEEKSKILELISILEDSSETMMQGFNDLQKQMRESCRTIKAKLSWMIYRAL